MRYLFDNIDICKMWIDYQEGAFSKEEFKQFYKDIGYSVCGFKEIWGGK